jgi:hypothetical protein
MAAIIAMHVSRVRRFIINDRQRVDQDLRAGHHSSSWQLGHELLEPSGSSVYKDAF